MLRKYEGIPKAPRPGTQMPPVENDIELGDFEDELYEIELDTENVLFLIKLITSRNSNEIIIASRTLRELADRLDKLNEG